MLFVAFKILRSFIASFSTTTEDWSDLEKQNKTQDQTHFLIYQCYIVYLNQLEMHRCWLNLLVVSVVKNHVWW